MQPSRRPTFTALRSQFEALLLADNKDEYIDLIRIDHTKQCYQEFTNEGGCSKSGLSPNAFDLGACAGREKSKSPIDFDISLSHRLHILSDNGFDYLNSQQSLNSNQSHGLHRVGEENGRDRTNENAGRPVSMYLSRDKKERENDYVDEPSSMVSTPLTLPIACSWHTQCSNGAIEMDRFESAEPSLTSEVHNCPVEIQIQCDYEA